MAQEAPPCIDGFLARSTHCDKTSGGKFGSDVIHDACRAAGHTSCTRACLTPAAIIHWFLIQVLHGNTALNHVALMAGRSFTDSAFCQARRPPPLGCLPGHARRGHPRLGPGHPAPAGPLAGPSPFLLDGSSFSMPDTPVLQTHFGQPGNQAKGCGFPVAHILALLPRRAPDCCWRSTRRRWGRR